MKNSLHKIKHQAKKALRQAVMDSTFQDEQEKLKTYSDEYYKNLYRFRVSIHKEAIEHYIKEKKRHKKMGAGKKHAKRTTPGTLSEDHPYPIRAHHPNYDQKKLQTKIRQASHLDSIKRRKAA